MIRKLRVKFIALSMLSLFLVLATILGAINLINYNEIVEASDDILELLAKNDGRFPKMEGRGGRPGRSRARISPETPYESRFFLVRLDSAGNPIFTDTGKIAAVDSELAVEYAQRAASSGKRLGFIEDYRYTVALSDDGESLVIFLDCGKSLATFDKFLLTSLTISGIGMLAVLALITALSGRVIKPVSESYERQKQFVTNAGHEIKTPLTIIDADAELLEMEMGENQWLADIRFQNKRLSQLTTDLITLSRMEEEQRGQFAMIDFPVSDMVCEMADSFQALAISQQKSFSAQIKPLLTLRGDEKALRQLVSILLDNALKYCPISGAISVALERQGNSIRLTVKNDVSDSAQIDTGRLFDRFYRGDASRGSNTKGYGIGLCIAKAIVTAHKGKITASQPDGKALAMTVTLPVKQ